MTQLPKVQASGRETHPTGGDGLGGCARTACTHQLHSAVQQAVCSADQMQTCTKISAWGHKGARTIFLSELAQ